MRCARRVVSIVAMAFVSCRGFAQTIVPNGAGFDPTPVQIPVMSAGPKRPVTNMDLLTVRDLHGIQLSPDGKYVAFVVGQAVLETNSYRSGLFVVRTEGDGKPISLGTAGAPHWDEINQWTDDPPQWSRDSRYIYYRMNRSGTWQVWRWTLSGGTPVQVTQAEHDVKDFRLTPNGNQLVLSIDQPTFTPAEFQEISEHGVLYDENIRPWLSRPFLEEFAEVKLKDPETWIHDFESAEEHKATGNELRNLGPWESDLPEKQFTNERPIAGHHILSSRISPDGQSVAFVEFLDDPVHAPRDSRELFSKPIRGGTPVSLTPGAVVYDTYWWSPDSKQIYYTESGHGHSPRFMVVPATGGLVRPVVEITGDDWLDEFSADNAVRWVACTRENSDTPAQVALIDVRSGKLRVLVDVNPEFKNLQPGKSSRIEVSNRFGDVFRGHLVLPLNYKEGNRYPLIIVTYADGDFFLRGGVGDEYPIQVFAANGFAVLQFDGGHDRNFTPGDFDTAILQWESPVEGMKRAVEKLAASGIIDRGRVGITGLSHGAELVSYAISHSDFVHAAVESSGGAWSPYHYYITNKMVQGWMTDWGLDGWPEGKSAARWKKLSATLNADRISAPLLINVADTEYLSGLDEIGAMRALCKPVEMFVYPNESHVKNQPKHRYEIYERNIDWFKFWLFDKEDPDPAKRQQYERWRKLRMMIANDVTGCVLEHPSEPLR